MAEVTVRVERSVAELLSRHKLTDQHILDLEDILGEHARQLLDHFRGDGRKSLLVGRGSGLVPIETGRLLNSLQPDVRGLNLVIESRVPYAQYAHFTGEPVGQTAKDIAERFELFGRVVSADWQAYLQEHFAGG